VSCPGGTLYPYRAAINAQSARASSPTRAPYHRPTEALVHGGMYPASKYPPHPPVCCRPVRLPTAGPGEFANLRHLTARRRRRCPERHLAVRVVFGLAAWSCRSRVLGRPIVLRLAGCCGCGVRRLAAWEQARLFLRISDRSWWNGGAALKWLHAVCWRGTVRN
jgi:hypothetical protein